MYVLAPNAVVEQYPYSISDLRKDNSLPAFPTDALLAEYGVFPVERTDIPAVDYTQVVTEAQPRLVDGKWVQTWDVADRTAEEIDNILSEQWNWVRAVRNEKLAACDWTQLSDAPVDAAAWSVYRQELRDITNQTDPFNIIWPQEP